MLILRAPIDSAKLLPSGLDKELVEVARDLRKQHYATLFIRFCKADRYFFRCGVEMKKTIVVDLKEVREVKQKLTKWFERFHPHLLTGRVELIDHTYYKSNDYGRKEESTG